MQRGTITDKDGEREEPENIFSTTAFENIRKIIIETIASNYSLEKTENKDISGKVVMETIKTKKKNARIALPIFIRNIYRTTSTLLINGPKYRDFWDRYYQYYNHVQISTERK